MSPSSSAPALRLPTGARRALAALVAALLVLPLQALLATPAHAAAVPLAGVVTDTEGDPIEGVTVFVHPAGSSTGGLTGHTGAAGDYSVLVQSDVAYDIFFDGPAGYADAWYDDATGPADAPDIVVDELEGVTAGGEPVDEDSVDGTLLTTNPHVLSGVVTGPDGELPGVQVEVRSDADVVVVPAAAVTGTTYTVNLAEGDYRLRFVAPVDYVDQTWPSSDAFTVTRDGAVEIQGAAPNCTKAAQDELCPVTIARSTGLFPVRGRVIDEKDAALLGATVRAYAAGTGNLADDDVTNGAGAYVLDVPPGSYWLEFSAPGKATQWLTSFEDDSRTVVTVSAGGTVTAPEWMDVTPGTIDDVQLLLPAPTATVKPSISGKVAVGSRIEVKPGAWVFPGGAAYPFGQADIEDYLTVDWFIDGKPADDWSGGDWFQKFNVPAEAGGRKLSYRLTLDDPTAEAYHTSAVFTSDPIAVPKAKPKLKGTYAKGALRITVTVPELKKPTGKIKVLDGKKTVGKAKVAPANKGVVVVRVKLAKGAHKLTVVYSGTANVASAKKKVTVKV